MNENEQLNWEACKSSRPLQFGIVQLIKKQTDDPEKYDGAPIGLQIVGRGLQEGWILSVAEAVYAML